MGATSTVTQEIKEKAQKTRATNTRLQVRFPDGSRRVQVFEAEDTLKKVGDFVSANIDFAFDLVSGGPPPKKFAESDQGRLISISS